MARVGFALVVALLALAPGAQAEPLRASLQLLDTTPVVVRGAGFGAAERVTVRASVGGRVATKQVVARTAGRFTVRFPGLSVGDRCTDAVFLSAVGNRGSRAAYKLPMPQCPPPLANG